MSFLCLRTCSHNSESWPGFKALRRGPSLPYSPWLLYILRYVSWFVWGHLPCSKHSPHFNFPRRAGACLSDIYCVPGPGPGPGPGLTQVRKKGKVPSSWTLHPSHMPFLHRLSVCPPLKCGWGPISPKIGAPRAQSSLFSLSSHNSLFIQLLFFGAINHILPYILSILFLFAFLIL